MALFCDFENLALGVRDGRRGHFDVQLVAERLLSRGSIVVKKAYADWTRYREYKREMHASNFELIEVPNNSQSGKNSADIRMVVDALDLCYTKEHVSTFVLITGDSDFSPLVSKLRENNKMVIGVGVRNSTSDLLVSNCDEFIFYDDLSPGKARGGRGKGRTEEGEDDKTEGAKGRGKSTKAARPRAKDAPKEADAGKGGGKPKTDKPRSDKDDGARGAAKQAEADAPKGAESAVADEVPVAETESLEDAWDLLLETLEAMFADRSDSDTVWASMLKQSVKRRRPGFSEKTWGYRTFGQMLEAAVELGLLEIEKEKASGNYRILGFGPNG